MERLTYGKSICYSGFRKNQSPITNTFPTYEQVKEDLTLLDQDFDYIRMYAPSKHAEVALQVIEDNNLQLKVMLGMDLLGEISNPNCAWGGVYSPETIQRHIKHNDKQLLDLIRLANQHVETIFAVSAGNEAVPEWNENLVSPERVLHFVKELKEHTTQLVTYCENFLYWKTSLRAVAEEIDFISLHTYPIWTGVPIEYALQKTIDEYYYVKNDYPHKTCIITEAGWPTHSDNKTIKLSAATIENHRNYILSLDRWSEENKIHVFFFEAFDEPWKGSSNHDEPEKHWGFYDVLRNKKLDTKRFCF